MPSSSVRRLPRRRRGRRSRCRRPRRGPVARRRRRRRGGRRGDRRALARRRRRRAARPIRKPGATSAAGTDAAPPTAVGPLVDAGASRTRRRRNAERRAPARTISVAERRRSPRRPSVRAVERGSRRGAPIGYRVGRRRRSRRRSRSRREAPSSAIGGSASARTRGHQSPAASRSARSKAGVVDAREQPLEVLARVRDEVDVERADPLLEDAPHRLAEVGHRPHQRQAGEAVRAGRPPS